MGVIAGAAVPAEWSLDFAIPLVLMALLFPAVTDRHSTIAALAAAVAAVAFVSLPLNLGLLVAAAIGIGAGTIWGRG